ncbi:DUF1801 domain-containing protein [Pseudaestuariivita sp.]|uniref:DUF1801 domain-containing protein n=1 Tax=Pseudaestuariivita sp. TaxID=2211669 RepID=UPI004059AC9D
MEPPFQDPKVKTAFAAMPEACRPGLLELRALIFEVAASRPEIGRLEETLKWCQPAYLTPEPRSGSTIRLGLPKTGGYALYTHCQTTLLSEFRALFPDDFTYEGNRAIHFTPGTSLPRGPVATLIGNALTYHRR